MKIIAHRGASSTFPENTLAAFRKVVQLPVDGVELDVHLTKDRHLVVIHDETINRTSNGKGYIKDMTLAQLRQYDYGSWFDDKFCGERIPTLREVLQLFIHSHHQIHIELKTDVFSYEGIEELVLREVLTYGMEKRVVISSFNHESIQHVIELAPYIKVAALFSDLLVDYLAYAREIPVKEFHVSKSCARQQPVKQLVQAGFPVRVYTVNKVEDMEYFEKLGAEAIFTDKPEKMWEQVYG